LSFHWTSTMSAHNIRVSTRRSSILSLYIGERRGKDYEGSQDKIALLTGRVLPATPILQRYYFRGYTSGALMAKQALIILVTVIAFGILVPWYKGFTFLDPRVIAAYGCLALLFVTPASAESSDAGLSRIAAVVAFGWGITVVTMLSGLATLSVAYGNGKTPPMPVELIGAVLVCSLTASTAVAAFSAMLARRFSPHTAKAVLRLLFLLVLLAFAFSSRMPERWQIFLTDHTTRRAITRLAWEGAAVCAVLTVGLLIPLRKHSITPTG